MADGPFISHNVSNDSPFPPPESSTRHISQAIEAHLEAATRFFEACPILVQLRVSMVPSIPGCDDILMEGDHAVLGAVPGSERPHGMTVAQFGKVKAQLQEKAHRRRRQERRGQPDETPQRPLYVNNINSQRLHCCFRSLYGKDEVEIEHQDIMPKAKGVGCTLPGDVDIAQ